MPSEKRNYLPIGRIQNPAPPTQTGQQAIDTITALKDQIMLAFREVLPSNYVSQVEGPYYLQQFGVVAEQLASVQLALQETSLDTDVDFTRPEFLWQFIGTLAFPESANGIPQIPGDISYRTFLKRIIALILEGSKLSVQKRGVETLTDALVTVLAKVDYPGSAWGFDSQHEFEVNVSGKTTWTLPNGDLVEGDFGTGFADHPFRLARNVRLVLRALKPAKALYEYRNLFQEQFPGIVEDASMSKLHLFHYDDFRKFCCGLKAIEGTLGETLADQMLFSDVSLSFASVPSGATLEILSGPNSKPSSGGSDSKLLGVHEVLGTLTFPVLNVEKPYPYTTSPSGLQGQAQVIGGEIFDPNQDFSNAVEGEVLEFQSGPNAGKYRLQTLIGSPGGAVGFVAPGSGVTRVRPSPSILRLKTRAPFRVGGQSYRVTLQRTGVQEPNFVVGEDVSAQFWI